MTDTSSKTPEPPGSPPPPAAPTATPRSLMEANEKLIGRSIVISGPPARRQRRG